jgi:hypothetical protein
MCDSYEDRLFWIRRVEQMRKETEAQELKKQSKTAIPAKPAAPEKGVEESEPIPA